MAWNVKARLRELVASEKGAVRKEPGGRLKVALIWPGTYRTGMSALGFLSIYGRLNSRQDVLAERFFWPEGDLAREYERSGGPLLSLESGRPLKDFDLVAASLSLENDYWYFPRILTGGGLAPLAANREESDPPVLAGGVAIWANPWPLMPYADLILAGEAEAQWPELISAWDAIRFSPLPKPDLLRLLSRNTPGTLHPGAIAEPLAPPGQGFGYFFEDRRQLTEFDPIPQAGTRAARGAVAPSQSRRPGGNFENLPTSEPLKPAVLAWPPVGLLPPVSPILTPKAEFADTKLVEISRGCPYGCRFCLAGFIFRPHRPWPLESILEALGDPEAEGEKVGLVSPAAADHPQLDDLLDILFQQKRVVTLSSLRLSAITPLLAEKLAAGRLHGAAVAPEGGSQRLRDIINKDLTEEVILEGARLLAEAGLKKIKLYFMVGLPEEEDEDLLALAELCRKIRQAARKGPAQPELLVSLANFTPKAHTPFESAAMNTAAEFKRKGQLVSRALKGIPRLSVNLDPPLWAIAQGLLARGGPESRHLIEAMVKHEGRLKASLAEIGYSPDHPVHRPWPEDRPKPWRIIEPAAGFDCLEKEELRSRQGLVTPACPTVARCGRCLACG